MGFLSNSTVTPNKLEQKRLERIGSGRPVLDLTDSNLTNLSARFPPEILRSEFDGYLSNRRYQPDPRGLAEARNAVAEYYSERGAKDIPADGIFFTASTSEAYRLLFSLLAEPGEPIAVPSIGYPLIEAIAADARLECRHYKLEQNGAAWRYSPDFQMEDGPDLRAICVITPHNPTGHVMRELPEWMLGIDAPLIADEVFCEYVWSGGAPAPLSSIAGHRTQSSSSRPQSLWSAGNRRPQSLWSAGSRRPIFHLHGLSKLLALPDLKLGWIALNSAALEIYGERLAHLNDLYLSAGQMMQSALPAIFRTRSRVVPALRQELRLKLESAIEALESCPGIEVLPPEAGGILFPRLLLEEDAESFALRLLEETGTLIHPGYFYCDAFPDNFSQHFLISALTPPETLALGLRHLVRLAGGT